MGARKAEMTLLENVWETILTVFLKFCQKNIMFPEQFRTIYTITYFGSTPIMQYGKPIIQ